MLLRRVPRPVLRPFVQTLWATDESIPSEPCGERERVLPIGSMHLVFRFPGQPLEIFDDLNDSTGRTIGDAIVGGSRSGFYVKDVSKPAVSIGAQLMPGAS
jgi:hypothetical protein